MKKTMNYEIKKRLTDSNWDQRMASRVLTKRAQKTRLRAALMSSAATMILALTAFLMYNTKTAHGDKYDAFIASQINGTYNAVFNKKQKASQKEILFNDEIDTMIDDTLAQR